jgi:DNA-binding transcriptional MerR regulator
MSNGTSNSAASKAAAAGCSATVQESNSAGNHHTLTVGVVARMFNTSKLQLRLYEFRGLIRRKRDGRERVYSWYDCERIALIVKARRAGLAIGDLVPIIKAMEEYPQTAIADAARVKCLSLIHALEDHQRAARNVLGELYRIDWELSGRRGLKTPDGSSAADEQA